MSSPNSLKPLLSRMFKTRQEQRLAWALALVIVCAGAYRIFATGKGLWAAQYATITALESQRHLLKRSIEENDLARVERIKRQRISLPSDSALAATRYYTWLHELASKHGWSEVKIDSNSPVDEPLLGERIVHSIQARASVEAIGKWLDDFQGYPLLHGLTNLQVLDYSPLTGEARVQLNIETLCLEDAPPDLQLVISENSAATDGMLAAQFSQNNPFRRYEPPKPVSVSPVEEPPKIDPLSKIKFVGIVVQNQQSQAWFFDSLQNNEFLVPTGNLLSVNGFEGQLTQLDQDCATLEHQGQRVQVRLGQDLRTALSEHRSADEDLKH